MFNDKKIKYNKVVYVKFYIIIYIVLNMYEIEMGYIYINKINKIKLFKNYK